MTTSSPASSSACARLKKLCLPPTDTSTWSGVNRSPFSRSNLATTACFKEGVPSTAVYLVKPARIARIAASLMCAGVNGERGGGLDAADTGGQAYFRRTHSRQWCGKTAVLYPNDVGKR